MAGALANVRILDLTQGSGGPYCTMQLGDGGADVIKLEPPGGDWARALPPFAQQESAYFLGLNRNKRSIVIDLTKPAGKEAALRLIAASDVVVQNYGPGVAERLGVDYEAARGVNPAVVYCSLSALDSQGPEAQRVGTELTVQARGRVMAGMNEPEEPPVRFGSDALSTATALYAAQAIVAALFHRQRSGQGQHVRASLLRSAIHLQTTTVTFDCAPDGGLDDPRMSPPFPNKGYRTKDLPITFSFPYMLVGYPADERFREFCHRVGLGHIADDPRFADNYARADHGDELREYYEQAFADKTSAELLAILEELGALNTVHSDFPTLFAHPQVEANHMIEEFDHPTLGKVQAVGMPWKMSVTPGTIRRPPPLLGQHTDEVLAAHGYVPTEIATMRAERAAG